MALGMRVLGVDGLGSKASEAKELVDHSDSCETQGLPLRWQGGLMEVHSSNRTFGLEILRAEIHLAQMTDECNYSQEVLWVSGAKEEATKYLDLKGVGYF